MSKPHTLQLQAQMAVGLTQEVQHSLRLLSLPALELGAELRLALERNPFLEPDTDNDTVDADDAFAFDSAMADASAARLRAPDADHDAWPAAEPDLREHLRRQIAGSRLADPQRLHACVVVDALDADGYLRQDLQELVAALPQGVLDAAELAVALRFVQSLEPVGVGARDPAECLELQLRALPAATPGRSLALRLVHSHLALLASHDVPRLCAALGCEEAALRRAHALITSLDPHPGHRFGGAPAPAVVADVIVHRTGSAWRARINPEALPCLRVNERYVAMCRAEPRHASQSLAQELQEARWLLRALRQRWRTIERVAQAIVDAQPGYFEHGDIGMRALMQRDVARRVGVHESTVSRVVHGKAMATPHGLRPFDHFFGTPVQATDGQPCAATAVRALIRALIDAEDPRAPLSDIRLTQQLARSGVKVARRTVTKYRDAMRIAPWQARLLAARHGLEA